MPEIDVEGEPWLGLVVLADQEFLFKPGHYALARADEWHSDQKAITIWRGPDKKDQLISKSRFTEEECRTVLVDQYGFYTCELILEDLEEDVREESEKLLDEMANERAAESASYIDEENGHEKYGDEVFVKAEFGGAVAVNGEQRSSKYQKPPRNYELTNLGGRWPSGEEAELDKEPLVETIAMTLTERLKRSIYPETVKKVLDKLYPKDYIMWTSGSGYTEVWASKRAIRKHESDEDREAREKEERYQRMIKADRQRIEAERKREAEYRQAKIRRGGFPGPKDWSPRGRLPGDR